VEKNVTVDEVCFTPDGKVKRWSRFEAELVEVSARLVPRTVPIHRALTSEGRATPRVTAFVAPLFASAVYTL